MHELLKNVILPPASLLICALLGHVFGGKSKLGRTVTSASLFLLYLLSTPFISNWLISTLEVFPPLALDGPMAREAQAIVILSAETRISPEYSSPSPGPLTLERLRYGAWLYHRTGLPVLVTGGVPSGQTASIASVMRQSLTNDFHLPVAWVEEQSQDTHQNATGSAAILKAEGITKILLVTHAWHMPRAKLIFERAGMTVIPAPTAYATGNPGHDASLESTIREALPSAKGLQDSYFALHEILGLAFYRLAFP